MLIGNLRVVEYGLDYGVSYVVFIFYWGFDVFYNVYYFIYKGKYDILKFCFKIMLFFIVICSILFCEIYEFK